MSVLIKRMETEREIRGKAYVHWKSWQEAYPGLVRQEFLDRLSLEKCEQIAFGWQDGMLIAKDGENVVGFVGYGHREGDPPDACEIFALYVLSAYYGQGVGARLMDAALDRLKGGGQIRLWTLKNNERVIRFYRKCGFVPDGEKKENERLGATEIRMTLRK